MTDFFKITTGDINIIKNEKSDITYDKSVFEEYYKLYNKVKNSESKIVKYNKQHEFDVYNDTDFNDTQYVKSIFNMSDNLGYIGRSGDEKYPEYIVSSSSASNSTKETLSKDSTVKFKNIITITMSSKDNAVFQKLNNCFDRDEFLIKINLEKIYYLFKHLEIGGNALLSLSNTGICSSKTIEFIYLYSSLFEYVVICNGNLLYGFNFNPKIKQEEIKKLYDIDFKIEPKNNLKDFIKYEIEIFKQKSYLLKLLLDEKEDEYLFEMYNYTTNIILNGNFINDIFKKDILVKIKKHLINYFKVIFLKNDKIKVHSNIKKTEGDFISDTINKYSSKKCLEVGMAFGISALYILQNKNTTLTSIDPFQTIQWKNGGVELLKSLDFDKRHTLIEDKSYIVLPELLKKNEKYDFIFIDGFHTFDYTLIDFFYADKLLKINGIIIVDDILHSGVKKSVKYITTNYEFYKQLPSPLTVGCYQKIKEDDREWNYHKDF